MVVAELSATFRAEIDPALIAHAWPRLDLTSAVTTAEFGSFVQKARRVGFLRDAPALTQFVEAM
jgi:hypothetical protein